MAKSNIKGLKEFVAFTDKLSKDVEQQAIEIVREATFKTERDAKQLAPVDTGYLRNSIQSAFSNGGLVGTVSTNVEYALFVEFGTSKQPAQPFLFPAFHSNMQKFLDDMKRLAGGR